MEEGLPARSIEYTDDEMAIMKEISLISMKPVIYAANVAEDDFSKGIENNEFVNRVKRTCRKRRLTGYACKCKNRRRNFSA